MKAIHNVLETLGLPVSSATVVNVQGGLRALIPFDQNDRSPSLDIVPYALFERWYLLNTQEGMYKSNNALLVKRVRVAASLECGFVARALAECPPRIPDLRSWPLVLPQHTGD